MTAEYATLMNTVVEVGKDLTMTVRFPITLRLPDGTLYMLERQPEIAGPGELDVTMQSAPGSRFHSLAVVPRAGNSVRLMPAMPYRIPEPSK